uniref:hypothetical protein n=1 Tax=Watanabea sichuanensis TaxID=2704660 RepID=UPI0024118167|nr:hypothetical protein P8479_pgp015 [Watanabea sichuanensis]WDY13189.1 hypothetical protein [Watanabea sichuanensis]
MTSSATIKDTRGGSWSSINWAKAHRTVNNLQRRIFVAKQKGRFRTLRKLQKLLLTAQSNRLLAVRQVCQLNSGGMTPGVDNRVYLSPQAKMILADSLRTINMGKWKAMPAKRTYIFKSNGKVRPLGIPTLTDRALQCIVKRSLEPEWEAVFEASSYGFRPSRSAQDAIRNVHNVCNSKSTKHWIVQVDIKGCFDKIDHDFILKQLNSFPGKAAIKSWLKAGHFQGKKFHSSISGTPQGGVISPLLSNIALHGMESALGIKRNKKGWVSGKRTLLRYANDFIIACKSKADALQVLEELKDWLKLRGLSICNEKTRIVHVEEGFNFLGFHVKLYSTSKRKIMLIKPSKEATKKLRYKLKQVWKQGLGRSVDKVVSKLNPIVRGWSHYFRHVCSSKTFSCIDHYMFIREYRFAKRTHPCKAWKWLRHTYWGKLNPDRDDRWVFGDTRIRYALQKFAWTHIKTHTMVTGSYSPFDPSLDKYWKKRASIKTSPKTTSHNIISKRQGYKCPICFSGLYNGESTQVHHLQPKANGGNDSYTNLALLHTECHKKAYSQKLDEIYMKHRLRLLKRSQ